MTYQIQRVGKRVPFETHVKLRIVSGDGGITGDSSTIDLSESGVRLRLEAVVQPGQLVEVFLSSNPEPCRVVWVRESGLKKERIAGLQFLRPLPEPPTPKAPPVAGSERVS